MRKLIALLGRRVILSGMAVLIAGISFSVPVLAVTGPWIYLGNNYPTQAAALAAMHANGLQGSLMTVLENSSTSVAGGITYITYTYGAPTPLPWIVGAGSYSASNDSGNLNYFTTAAAAAQFAGDAIGPVVIGGWCGSPTYSIGPWTYIPSGIAGNAPVQYSCPGGGTFQESIGWSEPVSCPGGYILTSTACIDPQEDSIACTCSAIPTGQTASVAIGVTTAFSQPGHPITSTEQFRQSLTPVTNNWLGRTVTEQFNGPTTDDCFFEGSSYFPVVAKPYPPSTLNNSQGSFIDVVGVEDNVINYYRSKQKAPCIIEEAVQTLLIDCPNAPLGTATFTTDILTVEIGTSTVIDIRNGTPATIQWGTPQLFYQLNWFEVLDLIILAQPSLPLN